MFGSQLKWGNNLAMALGLATVFVLSGCETGSITAVNLDNPKEPEGIPYYLPKPYLVVCKNVRYIPTPTVGLTQTVAIPNSFDTSGGASPSNGTTAKGSQTTGGQSQTGSPGGSQTQTATKAQSTVLQGVAADPTNAPADNNPAPKAPTDNTGSGNSNISSQVMGPASIAVVPAASIPDGLTPDTFYTYQIIYLPDLTQKYGLRVEGGDGEMRATLNLVNGWMHTGPGPIYFRDSSTAQDVSAVFTGISGTLDSGANLFSAIHGYPAGKSTSTSGTNKIEGVSAGGASGPPTFTRIKNFAAIWVYEPVLVYDSSAVGGKRLKWRLMTDGAPIIMSRIVSDDQSQAENNGGGTDQMPPDANPSLTKQATAMIQAIPGLEKVSALRSVKNATGWTVVIDTNLGPTDIQTIQTKLASLKVTQVTVSQ